MNREFTVSSGYKIFYSFLAVVFIVGGVLLCAFAPGGNPGIWFVSVMFSFLGLIFLLSAFKRRVLIDDYTITNVSLFKTNVINIADVKGIRENQKSFIVELNTSTSKVTIANFSDFADSAELKDWLKRNFKDLDAEEAQSELAAVLSDTSLGYTEEDRQAKLNRAKYIAIAYSVGGGIVMVCSLFADSVPLSLLTLIYPLLGAVVLFKGNGLIRLIAKKNSPYYHIFVGIQLPSIGLLIKGVSANMLHYQTFALLSIVVLLVFVALYYVADSKANTGDELKGKVIILLIFGGIYAAGAVSQTNMLFDRSPEQIYNATVLSEYVTHGKNTSYNLRLSPWGPQLNEHTVSVSSRMYSNTPVGDTVVIHLHNGFFNIPWYKVSGK